MLGANPSLPTTRQASVAQMRGRTDILPMLRQCEDDNLARSTSDVRGPKDRHSWVLVQIQPLAPILRGHCGHDDGRQMCEARFESASLMVRLLTAQGAISRLVGFNQKGGNPMRFARTCAGLGAVCSVGIALALLCDHLAALLDAAIAIC